MVSHLVLDLGFLRQCDSSRGGGWGDWLLGNMNECLRCMRCDIGFADCEYD